MIVELHGLEVFGRHGVDDEERATGRTYLYDVSLEVAEPERDELDATVDYRAVAACVRDVSERGEYRLIETLAAAVAEELAQRFATQRVTVRVRKAGISPAGLRVEYSAATAVRGS